MPNRFKLSPDVVLNSRHHLANGLRLAFLHNKKEGNFVRDYSPAGLHGTINVHANSVPTWPVTDQGIALAYSIANTEKGVALHLGTPSHRLIDTSTGNFAYTVKFKMLAGESGGTWIAKREGTTVEFNLLIANGNRVSYRVGGTTVHVFQGTQVDDEIWHTITYNCRGGTMEGYLDGVKKGEIANTVPTRQDIKCSLGFRWNVEPEFANTWQGYRLYEMFWNRTLDRSEAEQIDQEMDNLFTTPRVPATYFVVSGPPAEAASEAVVEWKALDLSNLAIPTFGGWSVIASPVSPTHNDTTVTGGTTYEYKVTAVDSEANESADSNIVQVTPASSDTVRVPLIADAEWDAIDGTPIVDLLNFTPEDNFGQFEVSDVIAILGQTDKVHLAMEETYEILSAEVIDNLASVVLEVGQVNLFKIQLPRNRWIDSRCEWAYRSIGQCDYGRDEFLGVSRMDLNKALDGDTGVQGWSAVNLRNTFPLVTADIDISVPDHLAIMIPKNVLRSNGTGKNGVFVYRTYAATDFDVEVKVLGNIDEDSELEGVQITDDSDDPQQMLSLKRRFSAGVKQIIAHKRVDGGAQSAPLLDNTNSSVVRIVKEGTAISFYHKLNSASSYSTTPQATTTFTQLDGITLRIGCVAETRSTIRSTDFTAKFDFIHLLSGGLPTCDRTLDGSNGCRVHENTRRHGAAPGILHGPFII